MTETPKADEPDLFDYEPDELHLVEPDEPPDNEGDAESAVKP